MVGQRLVSRNGNELDISYLDEGTLDDISACVEDAPFDRIEYVSLSSEHDQIYSQAFLHTFLCDLEVFPNLVTLDLSCNLDAAAVISLASYLERCLLNSVSFSFPLHAPDDAAATLFNSVAANDSIESLLFTNLTLPHTTVLSLAMETCSNLLHLQLDWSDRISDATISAVCLLVSNIPQLESFGITCGEVVNLQLDIGPLLQQLAHSRSLKSLHLTEVCLTDSTAHQLQDLFRTVPIETFCLASQCPHDELLAVLASIESSSLTSATINFCTSLDSHCSADQTAIALSRALQCPRLERLSMEQSCLNITVDALCRALQHRSCALKELRLEYSGTIAIGKGIDFNPRVFSGIQVLSLDTTTEGYSAFFHHVGKLPDLIDTRIRVAVPSRPPRLPHSLLLALQSKHIVSLGVLYPQSQEDLDRIREALLSNTSILQLFMTRKFTSDTTEAIRQILDRNRGLYFIQRNASLCALFTPHGKFASMRCLLDPRLIGSIQSYIPPVLPTSGHGITFVSQ